MNTNTVLAVYALGVHYHSGQWSRGYRLSCIAGSQLRRRFPGQDCLAIIEGMLDKYSKYPAKQRPTAVNLYWDLVDRYADEL
jgi:hypothetical protein